MRDWTPEHVAAAAGASLAAPAPAGARGPTGVAIDSRTLAPGELFVGLRGHSDDGGRFAARAVEAGAWGVLARSEHLAGLDDRRCVLLAVPDSLAALGKLAREHRRDLGATVIAVTGSTGKTATKDILAALIASSRPTVASEGNLNTEIGVPLTILRAGTGTAALVLELAMRGAGQIAELTAICEPDVGVIVNVGPAHLERLGSLEAIAAAKGELLAGMRAGAIAVLPARERLLDPHLRSDLRTVRFGEGGEVHLLRAGPAGVTFAVHDRHVTIEPGFRAAHLLTDLGAALAAADALGVPIPERLDVAFAALRGEHIALPGGVTVVNDCYNANPMSMRAALDDLAATAPARRVAVLGDMLELGALDEERYHRELGEEASAAGVALLVTVGPRAAWAGETFAGEHLHAPDAAHAVSLLQGRLRAGDTVLVKGSRGVALEHVATDLACAG
jgi:UDP-N-acetylmuramoyl-tripeptide--D-alanyl-D-alanine ligase